MMNDRQQALVSLLLATFPNFQSGDAEAAFAAYAIVLEKADPRDIEPGIMALINGEVTGFDGRFAPTATQLARSIRIALERRVDREIAERRALPPPKDDWVEPTPEQRARGKAILSQLSADLAAQMRTDDAEADRRRQELAARMNARFAPPMDRGAISRRLGIGATYSVGDPDADSDMGQMGAA